MKRITKKQWFGPKRYAGWGLSPRSWEGWLTILIFIMLVMIDLLILKDFLAVEISIAAILVILFIIIATLTGSRPGGPLKNSNH